MDSSERVVVVGSGPPGAAAALFLCKAGVPVVLLEAGAKRAAPGLTVRIRGFTTIAIRKRLSKRDDVVLTGDPSATYYEELAPGGLSNHWSCAVPRFAAEDLEDAERAGESYAWPLSYGELERWYDRVEPLLRIAGPSEGNVQMPAGLVRRARRLGSDWGGLARAVKESGRTLAPMPYAYGGESTATLSGTAFNSFVRLVRPALRTGRLTLRYGARVVRLEWSSRRRRIEAVVFRDARRGTEERVPCRAVVLAAGAFGTAEILLASATADFPDGLGNTHGVLGHYLHDHPLGKLAVDLERPISFYPAVYLTRPSLDRSPPLYAAACMQWTGTRMLFQSLLGGKPGRLPSIGFNVFGTMAPVHDNWIAFDRANPSPAGRPRLQLHIVLPPEARTALERARDDLVAALSQVGLGPRVKLWHLAPPCESVHYGGTCRMHASTRFGMLNGKGRLHAVSNVAVADSSAFTTGPEKNPVLTSMALAARASTLLAQDMAQGDV
jgi:choline dehydrogenase-like flavoprotein